MSTTCIGTMTLTWQPIRVLFLYLLWILPIDAKIILAAIILILIYMLLENRLQLPVETESIAVLLMLLMATYGITLGLVSGINPNYAFKNDGGMLIFLAYFIFRSSKNIYAWVMATMQLSGIFLILLLIYLLLSMNGVESSFMTKAIGSLSGSGMEGIYRAYAIGAFALFPYLILAFNEKSQLLRRSRFKLNLAFAFGGLLLIYLATYSKGVVIILFFLTAMLLLKRGRLAFKIGVLVPVILVGGYLYQTYSHSPYARLLFTALSEKASGNQQRYMQVGIILDDMKFFGNGAGSGYPGFIRDRNAPYATELSFFNVLHKHGIFSILMLGLGYCFMRSLYRILVKGGKDHDYLLLGAFMYWFPAIGNPILFDPVLVINLSLFLAYAAIRQRDLRIGVRG